MLSKLLVGGNTVNYPCDGEVSNSETRVEANGLYSKIFFFLILSCLCPYSVCLFTFYVLTLFVCLFVC